MGALITQPAIMFRACAEDRAAARSIDAASLADGRGKAVHMLTCCCGSNHACPCRELVSLPSAMQGSGRHAGTAGTWMQLS